MSNHTFEDYCLALRTELDINELNATTWALLSNRTKDFWKSPRVTVIRIEVLVVLAASMLLLLTIFGSYRRKRRSCLIQNSVLGAYTLSSSLVTYLLGSMQSSAVKSSLYPIWAISLYILLGCADSITAYSLDDNKQFGRQFYQFGMYNLYVALLVGSLSSAVGYIPALCLALIAEVKFGHRLAASRLASISWNLNKTVADYMYHQEHIKSGPAYDAASMKGYHYLVDWHLGLSELEADTLCAQVDDAQAIDIEMVWQCNDKTLSQELKDTCLSFSLFHLLRRRFFGFECGESSQAKTHDFVFKGLLSMNRDESIDYIRVFKVIEVELAFLYDFFFTKYATLYYGSGFPTFMSVASACLISVIACLNLTASRVFKIATLFKGPVILDTTRAEVAISIAILVCIALIEVLQLLHYRTTIWARVSLACQHIREQAMNKHGGLCLRFKEILSNIGVSMSNEHYFEEKLGQYSLLESVSYHPNPCKSNLLDISRKIVAHIDLIDLMMAINPPRYHRQRTVQQPREATRLPAEVRKAIVQSLQRTDGKLTNGASSLVYNRAPHLLWACRHPESSRIIGYAQKWENQACFILTWHIATCYCEMGTLKYPCPSAGSELTKKHHEVATKLSKYCAYLVVSAPRLLPGHHCDTRLVFESVTAEKPMEQCLKGAADKYEAMRSLRLDSRGWSESEPEGIFQKSVRLGKQLEEMEVSARWKVLADFWAEMLLYLAPSDNVKEHIECLAKGGEFITQLWALLTHAGILERDHRRNVDIENGRGAYHPSPGNQPPSCGSCVQPGTMVPQREKTVQIIGAPDTSTASSEIIVIES